MFCKLLCGPLCHDLCNDLYYDLCNTFVPMISISADKFSRITIPVNTSMCVVGWSLLLSVTCSESSKYN